MIVTGDVIRNFSIDSREIGINIAITLIIIIIGVFVGKLVKFILNRISNRLKLRDVFKFGSVDVALIIIKWTIYIFFIEVAIKHLNLPYISTTFTEIISIIPKSIGALIAIVMGFFLGQFFLKAIVQTKNKEWLLLGNISLYFFIYVSFIISIQLLFMPNEFLTKWITLILTGFFLLFASLKYGLKK